MSSIVRNAGKRLEAFAEQLFSRLNAPDERSKSTLGPTALILLLSVIASVLASWVTYRSTQHAQKVRFELLSRRIADEVGSVMDPYKLILRAGAGLFSAHRDVDAQRWREFVATIDPQRNHPGIQGLGFARVVLPGDVASHAQAMRRDWPDFEIRPSGTREIYTSIDFIEPRNWRNDRAIGYDMFADPTRRAAMEAARTSGSPRMSRAVTLVQETNTEAQRGVLVYMPVFRDRNDQARTGAAQADLLGYVYAAFRVRDLFDNAIRSQLPTLLSGVSVKVYDTPPDEGGSVLFDSLQAVTDGTPGEVDEPVLTTQLRRVVAGRTWELAVSSRPDFFSSWETALPWLVLGGGGAISLLVSGIAGTMAVARKHAVDARLVLEDEVKSRKAAQAALEISNREVLIANQELVHRVKNMMAVVSSIATQTARYTPNPGEFNAVFRERLAGLGRVHEFLKPNPGFRPDLKELVPELLAPYAGRNRKQLELGGPSVSVSQSNAVLLSVVINELASNAVRHGAWSTGAGVVALHWSVSAADGDLGSRVEFVWTERGGPKVTEPIRKGFGTNVLRFAVEQGLKGTFSSRYEPRGFTCAWSVPLQAGGGAEIDRVF